MSSSPSFLHSLNHPSDLLFGISKKFFAFKVVNIYIAYCRVRFFPGLSSVQLFEVESGSLEANALSQCRPSQGWQHQIRNQTNFWCLNFNTPYNWRLSLLKSTIFIASISHASHRRNAFFQFWFCDPQTHWFGWPVKFIWGPPVVSALLSPFGDLSRVFIVLR